MAKQTFTTGQVLTAAEMTTLQTNDYNQTVTAKTANYVLVAADAGTRITMSNAGATAITVNTSLFAAGDTLFITNIGAGACTITAGTATVSTASSLVLAQYDSGRLYFTSTGVSIWEKYQGAAAATTPTFVGCALNNTVAQTLTALTEIVVTFDNETIDTDGFHSTSSNTGRITIPSGKAGKYLITANILWVPSGTGARLLTLYKNGSTTAVGYYQVGGNAAGGPNLVISVVLDLAVADYVNLYAWQSSGGNLDLRGNNYVANCTVFQAQFLGA